MIHSVLHPHLAFGIPREPVALDPFFTFEDLKEARDSLSDSFDKDATFEYSIPPITDMIASLDAPSLGPSAPGTPGGDSRSKSRRKLPTVKREIRNLYTDSKSTRKWERLEMIGASPEYREFVRQMEHVVNSLKEAKPHCVPFLKPVKDGELPDYKDVVETPMDLSTLSRNLDNMLYWTSSSFEKDISLIFSNAKAYYSSPESETTLQHASELESTANELLEGFGEHDFSSERESLRDVLYQILPDAHAAPESTFEDPAFDPQADALKRYSFFKEDPSFTQWRSVVKQRVESDPSESEGAMDGSDSSATTIVSPDPLFELPNPEFLPSQWRVAFSPVYGSLAPESPLIRSPAVQSIVNGSSALPACTAVRLTQLLTHRNSTLLQRVKTHTTAHGLSPLDPNVERPIPPPESGNGQSNASTDEPRINLVEPTIRLVMPPPPSTSPGPGVVLAADGTAVPTGKAPAKLGSSQHIKSDLDGSDNEADDMASEAPPIIPFFSDENMSQADPIFDDVPLKHDPSTLTSSRLDDDSVSDILRQTVGLQLALAGYQGSHDSALNVLTDVVSGFIRRIGFAANTYLSAPGTLETLPEIMDRTVSEVFPRGIQSIKSFVVSETMKSDNCLRLVDASTMLGWVEASPSLSSCLIPPAHASSKSSSKNPQKMVAEAVLTQLIREDKLDEKASRLGETREFFLQQAPFAKRTSSHYAYKPLAYIGSTSSTAVGTPGGLHLVLPPNAHPLDAEAKAQAAAAVQRAASMAHARLPQGAVPPSQHMAHMMSAQPGHHASMQGLPPQQGVSPGPSSGMPPNGAPPQQMMQRAYAAAPGQGGPPGHVPSHGGVTSAGAPPQAHVAQRMPPGVSMPPAGAPKKGPMPSTIGYSNNPGQQPMPTGYGPPGNPGPQRSGPYPPNMGNYAQHPGLAASPHVPGGIPPGAKKTAGPMHPAAKATAARQEAAVRLNDEPSPRETSAKRKRPPTAAAPPAVPDDDDGEGEVRRTRNRRGTTAGAYGDEFYYEDDQFEDGDESEPKRKKRKTPAKSAKR